MITQSIIKDGYIEIQTHDHFQLFTGLSLEDIPFIPLFTHIQRGKKNSLNFRVHIGMPGIYVIKVKESNRIFTIGGGNNVYERIKHILYRRRINFIIDRAEVAIIRAKEPFLTKIVKQIKTFRPREYNYDLYHRFQDCICAGMPLPLEALNFRNIFEKSIARPVFSLRHLADTPGVYIITENEKIVYVGMGIKKVSRALYVHFLRPKKDRDSSHYRANYFYTREIFEYKAAVIEVPFIGRSGEEILSSTLALESSMIHYLDPLDNKKGVISEQKVVIAKTIAIEDFINLDALSPTQNPF